MTEKIPYRNPSDDIPSEEIEKASIYWAMGSMLIAKATNLG